MTGDKGSISIWFFIGVLLAFYGAIILGAGILAFGTPPDSNRVLSELHPEIWWGALLLVIGGIYSVKYYPKKS